MLNASSGWLSMWCTHIALSAGEAVVKISPALIRSRSRSAIFLLLAPMAELAGPGAADAELILIVSSKMGPLLPAGPFRSNLRYDAKQRPKDHSRQ